MKAVNLLPQDLRSSGGNRPAPAVAAGDPEAGGPGAFIVLGALALCVVALAGYVLTSNLVKDREAKLAETTAQATAVTSQMNALKPYADFESVANARIATVNDLATQRFDWEQVLRDVSRTLPADVTLSQLSGTLSSETGTGGGASSLRGALNVPAIELQGCTTGQSDVAELMSRLRGVDGVTRVSLSKSDKETATPRSMTEAASAASSSTLGDVNACGRGDGKPSFDLIMFFEDDADAAVDPAGTGTPAAAAAATPAPKEGEAKPETGTGTASTTSATTGTQGQTK
jgi:Tfp pilus assembly protein PilN